MADKEQLTAKTDGEARGDLASALAGPFPLGNHPFPSGS